MIKSTSKKVRLKKRHIRLRKNVAGTQARPRLSFFKSNKHIYAQLIDDSSANTLLSCSTIQPAIKNEFKNTWSSGTAKKLGEIIGKNALEKGIKSVVFDRGGFKYHGKVLAFAEGARLAGLKF